MKKRATEITMETTMEMRVEPKLYADRADIGGSMPPSTIFPPIEMARAEDIISVMVLTIRVEPK